MLAHYHLAKLFLKRVVEKHIDEAVRLRPDFIAWMPLFPWVTGLRLFNKQSGTV